MTNEYLEIYVAAILNSDTTMPVITPATPP